MGKVEKINSLNGIRGFAVLLVLLSHASKAGVNIHPFLDFSGAGRYGVFLFFVLSAFLLTRQFLDSKPAYNEIKSFVSHYFLRRFLRIYPLFIAALFAYYFLYKIGLTVYNVDGEMFIKSMFLLDSIGIFWAIPVEFQYYFLLPIIALIFLYAKKPIIIITILSLFTIFWWKLIPPDYATHLLPFLPIFVLGSVTALISNIVKDHIALHPNLINIANMLAIICLSLFILLIPNFYNHLFNKNLYLTAFHKEFLLFTLLSCSLVLFTVHGNGLVKKLMENSVMVFWGKISFSAYLGHMIILTAVIQLGLPATMQWFIFITLTASFAYLSFKYFELPLSTYHTFKKIYLNVDGKLRASRIKEK